MEDRKGNFKTGPNGLNKKHPAGVGGNLGARGVCVLGFQLDQGKYKTH
jgi:hypothetical protein